MTPLLAALGESEPAPVGDVEARRISGHRMFDLVGSRRAPITGVDAEQRTMTAADGATLNLTWYRPSRGDLPGSAALYLHGGGMIFSLEHIGTLYDLAVREYVAAAGVSLMARDRGGPAIAQQVLIYPMLDDRPATPDPQVQPFLTWTYDDNVTGWGALLGGDAGVPTELHVYPGCPHAFEALARDAAVSRRAISDRVRRLRAL